MPDYDLRVPIMISALQHHNYCPRQCALIHMEQSFAENVHTVRGSFEHERVDKLEHEVVAGIRVEYALSVWSDRLGLTGRCDVVEFHPDGSVYPVEYKHGKRKKWINDDLQLAAQAMCLEETLGKPVLRGAVFYQQSRRRREVVIDAALRAAVEETVDAVRKVLLSQQLPPPVDDVRRCPECSLLAICQPELARAANKLTAMKKKLFEPEDDAS